MFSNVAALAGPDGLARDGVRPTGLPWQEPDGGPAGAVAGIGRTDLHATIDTEGRSADRRGDFDDVYGDWDELREAMGVAGFEDSSARTSTTEGQETAGRRCAPRRPTPRG